MKCYSYTETAPVHIFRYKYCAIIKSESFLHTPEIYLISCSSTGDYWRLLIQSSRNPELLDPLVNIDLIINQDPDRLNIAIILLPRTSRDNAKYVHKLWKRTTIRVANCYIRNETWLSICKSKKYFLLRKLKPKESFRAPIF